MYEGPPVTIAWEYNPNTTILSIEEYEKARPVRRTQSQMILPRSVRVDMLRKEWGVSNHQIVCAVRSGVRAKNQRRTTLGNLGRTEKVEEMIEGATKKLLKTLFLRKGTSDRAHELEEQIQQVNSQRAQIVLMRNMKGEYDESESSCPWAADLLHDESESENGLSHASEDRFKATTSNRDGSLKIPEKPEPSESDRDLSSVPEERQIQSTGESASQVPPHAHRSPRPIITAVEPDDDEEQQVSFRSSKSDPVDC